MKRIFIPIFPVVACLFLNGCFSRKLPPPEGQGGTVAGLKFLSEYVLPHNLKYANTTAGGLSGIDYDRVSNEYYLICDDRSEINPARFYKAKINISGFNITGVDITALAFLHQQNGAVYPDRKLSPASAVDPEALRYNPVSKLVVWSSEGERVVRPGDTVLINPSVNLADTNGRYRGTVTLPANLAMHSYEQGPRRNGVLEGLTFAEKFQGLYASVEEPLYEDGPRAGLAGGNAFIRLFKFDLKSGKNTAQYGYLLEPVPNAPVPADGEKMNGVSDILACGSHQLLVTERSYSEGHAGCVVKVFLADLAKADNILEISSLKKTPFRPASKKLLLNMNDLGIYIDNIEGMTFGPVLPNGHRSLLFVADNNFNASEKSQFLLFEVLP